MVNFEGTNGAIEDEDPVVNLGEIEWGTSEGVKGQGNESPAHKIIHECGAVIACGHCLNFKFVGGAEVLAVIPEADTLHVAPIFGEGCAETGPSGDVGGDGEDVVVANLTGQGEAVGVADGGVGDGDGDVAPIAIDEPASWYAAFKVGDDREVGGGDVGGGGGGRYGRHHRH